VHSSPSLNAIASVVTRTAKARRLLLMRRALLLAPPILGGALLLAVPPLLVAHARPLPPSLLRWQLPILMLSAAALIAGLLWKDRPGPEEGARELGRVANDEERLLSVLFPWRSSPMRTLVAKQVAQRSPTYDPRRMPLPPKGPILTALVLLSLVTGSAWWAAPRRTPVAPGRTALLRRAAESLGLDSKDTSRILPEELRGARSPDEIVDAARRILEKSTAPDPLSRKDVESLARALESGDRPAARDLAADLIPEMTRVELSDDARARLREALAKAAASEPDPRMRAALSAAAKGDLGSGLAAALGLGRPRADGGRRLDLERKRRLALAILQAAGVTGRATATTGREPTPSKNAPSIQTLPTAPALVAIPERDRGIAQRYLELHGWRGPNR